jgi:hypothetical protein
MPDGTGDPTPTVRFVIGISVENRCPANKRITSLDYDGD